MTGVTAKVAARREAHEADRRRQRAVRAKSVRLGPESFTPAVPDVETLNIVRAAVDLKDKGE